MAERCARLWRGLALSGSFVALLLRMTIGGDEVVHYCLAEEVVIGFVDKDDCVRRGVSDAMNLLARDDRARWVIGRAEDDELRLRRDGGKQSFVRKTKCFVGLDTHGLRAHGQCVHVVHEEGRHREEALIAFFEKGEGDDVDGFIDCVGQQHLLRLKAQVLCDDGFNRCAFGIDGEAFKAQLAECFAHAW